MDVVEARGTATTATKMVTYSPVLDDPPYTLFGIVRFCLCIPILIPEHFRLQLGMALGERLRI